MRAFIAALDPMSNMIRQIMALFDDCRSKQNAKHALRAMKENAPRASDAARRRVWDGETPNQFRGSDFAAAMDLLSALNFKKGDAHDVEIVDFHRA